MQKALSDNMDIDNDPHSMGETEDNKELLDFVDQLNDLSVDDPDLESKLNQTLALIPEGRKKRRTWTNGNRSNKN